MDKGDTNVLKLFKPVRVFVFDLDGVLTDGSLLIMPGGEWIRRMNIKDGYALQLAVKNGYKVLVISGSHSAPVAERLSKLGIKDVFMKVTDKETLLANYVLGNSFSWEQVLYMGDDMPDLHAMKVCGLKACPADAAAEIISIADYISPLKGGEGCARDVIEKVLKLNKHWTDDPEVASM